MLDIKFIRENPEALDKAMVARGKSPIAKEILDLDMALRAAITATQEIRQQKNLNAALIQSSAQGRSKEEIIEEGARLRDLLSIKEAEEESLQAQFNEKMSELPNIPDETCVIGKDENDNLELRRWGEQPKFDFPPKEHYVLGEELGLLNTERAVKISGSRFALLIGALAHLERAVAQIMLDTHVAEYGYKEIYVPQLVKEEVMYGTAQLPKFRLDQFQTVDNFWLIPTAEVALTNLVRDEVVQGKDLPLRITAYTQCFRSEAGSAGRDMQGIFRLRQFSKVELVSITTPEQERQEHERMTAAAENILKKLELPYRVVCLCTGDMGFASKKTYDIEVWLPGQNKYREISSCSMCGDFQARRMKAKYSDANNKTNFVCTLNGSGLAVGRTVLAIMENYQRKDGSIVVPEALRKYMNGQDVIRRDEERGLGFFDQ
ncbi:MAG: serine--tRNA ligase [Holosporales bacterium]|jgi:seryl-tRNA synthetase|nr:serine--tRNA ligase [Holosporales bacterium]